MYLDFAFLRLVSLVPLLHHVCHSNLKKSKAMKAQNLAKHKKSTKDCDTCGTAFKLASELEMHVTRSDTPRRAPKLLEGAESAARTPKATNSCAFSAVDWWTHRLSPTQATLTPTGDSYELQSFRGTYS
nr:hypothetical protein CFP56_16408 [Quercus suber]